MEKNMAHATRSCHEIVSRLDLLIEKESSRIKMANARLPGSRIAHLEARAGKLEERMDRLERVVAELIRSRKTEC